MKNKFLLVAGLGLLATGGLMAQKVKRNRIDLEVPMKQMFTVPDTVRGYSTNYGLLSLSGFEERGTHPDVKLGYKKFPSYKYNVYGKKDDEVTWSEATLFQVKDANDELLFHRVFVEFEQKSASQEVREVSMLTHASVTRTASLLFSPHYSKSLRFQFYYVEKSAVHNDVNEGYNLAMEGVENYNQGQKALAFQQFEQAIGVWNKVLEDRDINDKKARINKRVTEAVYRNLIQTYIICERLDEAEALMKSSGEELSGIFQASLPRYNYVKRSIAWNVGLANEDKPFTLYDAELSPDLALFTKASVKRVPDNTRDVNSLLVGSWRYYYISADGLPEGKTEFEIDNRDKQLMGMDNVEILHLNPDGTKIDQEGSLERTGKQRLDDQMPFWRAVKGPKGEYYLFFSYDAESLENPEENFNSLEHAVIHHIDEEKLVLRRTNYNPDANASGYFIQLQRVGFLD